MYLKFEVERSTSMKDTTVEVPHVGKSVEVRAIPPKLQRMIHAKATKGGRIDFQELMVWKLVYGLKDPSITEAEAREITQRFTLRTLQPIVDQIDRLSGTDEHLRGADRPHAAWKIAEPVMMATAWLGRFPDVVPATARSRESHGAKPSRHRGSRRGERAASSSSDDPEPEPPPSRRRLCACCGCDIPDDRGPRAKYFNDQHAARDRQRRKRTRDRARAPATPRLPTPIDELRMLAWNPGDYEQLLLCAVCRCNGHHILERDPTLGDRCCKCGRQTPGSSIGEQTLLLLAGVVA
jgi:hypothetical protein